MPLSPTGKGSPYNNVPVKIGGRALIVAFRPNVENARTYIPNPLELKEPPLGLAKCYHLIRSPVDEDLKGLNPEKTQYSEGAVALTVSYQGLPGQFNMFNWVDQEDALLRGREIYGVPKKLGKITLTTFQAHDPYGPGSVVTGMVSRHSDRIMTVSAKLTRQVDPKEVPRWGDFYHTRIIASPDPDFPDIKQLVRLNNTDVKVSDVWEGQGSVSFGDSQNEEVLGLQPEAIVGAWYFNLSWVLPTTAKVVHLYE